jgi:hypothetical protein
MELAWRRLLLRASFKQSYCTLAIQLAYGGRVMFVRVEVEVSVVSEAARVFTIVPVIPEPARLRVMVFGVAVKFIATTTAGPELVERT